VSGNALPTVIIPVHNAPEELARCLGSMRSTEGDGASVIVIDDASTDPSVARVLEQFRRVTGPNWDFRTNRENLGFVTTANLGMRMSEGHVVLLNSDTEVTPGWLNGLRRCLDSDPGIATATPWTNNGEIASLPGFCRPNPPPPDPARVAEVIAGCGAPVYPELPTAVGFCMAISRAAIERIGLFDAEVFGRGYGEENDFSMRAAEAGMRNVLCDDVYVVHLGGRSFGPLGLRPGAESMQRLLSLHPTYLQQVQAFIASDPLAARRQQLLDALDSAGVRLD
jgi:GT2 family glycosyltransferase